MLGDKNSISIIKKNIRKSRLCSTRLDASSGPRTKGVPINNQDRQEIKISIRMTKFHFWVKYAVFIKNENDFFLNSDFCYTWSNDHIQQMFQI